MALEIPFEVTPAEDHAEQLIFDMVGLSTILTDLNAGGVARTVLEALAIQLEALDSKMFFGLQRAIPTELYAAFNFPLLGAVKSTGAVTFSRKANTGTAAVAIPAGTIVTAPAVGTAPEVSFVTLAAATLPAGKQIVDVGVSASVAGTAGNISAGRVNAISGQIAGIGGVYNYTAIKNGADVETAEARAVRFRVYIQNLARSPLAGLEAGALTAQILDNQGALQEIVRWAKAIEPDNTLGRVAVYIDNGGGTASAELIALAQRNINGYTTVDGQSVPGYKAAGIVVTVSAIEAVSVAVTAQIEIADGYDFATVALAVQDAIENFFLVLPAGSELIIVDLIVAIAEVSGVRDLVMTTPTTNQNPANSQRLLAGTITLTQL